MSNSYPSDPAQVQAERLLKEYRKRFGEDPPFFFLQGQELLNAVKEALKTNRPIPFDVPEDGFA